MVNQVFSELHNGFETACINGEFSSSLAFKPQFVSNDSREGRKVLSSIEDELLKCEHFQMSVAFITMGGITPFLQTLQELEQKGVTGEILTTNYLCFSDPKALKKLHQLKNIRIKMYDVEAAEEGFHTKGYIFQRNEIYHIIIGSSNMTSSALTTNREWNTKFVSTSKGEMAQEILEEFRKLWSSPYASNYEDFIEEYTERYQIIKHQKETARRERTPSLEKYRLQPNSMQVGFIKNLRDILSRGEDRALLISATGTGKTYASAFAMRELGFRRVLFLVHRGQLAVQTKKSYEKVFDASVSMGIVGAGYQEYDADYVFATVQTLNRDANLANYSQDAFDCIILDEAHHSSAETYQKIMGYFTPRLWLGMTATPDKRDDNAEKKNIYAIFHYQIAYEIRLQQAMEEKLLCPFNYFGISDLSVIGDEKGKGRKLSAGDFNQLVSDERVKHVLEKAEYYGYSGDRVKGLVFCSRVDESIELSAKFNEAGYRTIALNGDASEEERMTAFERLAMDEADAAENMKPLDYIFSVDILNEGVDIVEVNQVIMLRPTQSPIVFIQQLGRGLRKAEGKEYVVILDFIGNYEKNFMIPVALSGDRTYNADTIRRYVISGNSTIPGTSTIHFDEIAKERIFQSIDKIRGIKAIIRESYTSLKNRLGRVPYMVDFYENGEVDPLLIIREYKTYQDFLTSVEKEEKIGSLTENEKLTLEYLSKTILSGVRPYELEILKRLFTSDSISIETLQKELWSQYGNVFDEKSLEDACSVLQGKFVSKEEEYQKYCHIDIVERDTQNSIHRMKSYAERLQHAEFYRQLRDLVTVGIHRYQDKYERGRKEGTPFVLYEKYSRRDVSLLMNCGKDLSSIMYGMKRIGDDVFIFITYHKAEAEDETKLYADGKPDYADAFADSTTFRWDSQIGKGPESSYMKDVLSAKNKHLLVKKSDAETNFYYMGTFDIVSCCGSKKKDNSGKERDITKVTMKMHQPVREDLLRYLESNIEKEEKQAG